MRPLPPVPCPTIGLVGYLDDALVDLFEQWSDMGDTKIGQP
jgi:hypothetical protein